MAADSAAVALLDLPDTLTLPFCTQLAAALDAATRRPPAFSQPLTAVACVALLRRAEKLLKAEPTLVHVHPPDGSKVVVAGDLHGQYHDILTIFDRVGFPSPSTLFVFDGDFVDRGAWGLETVVLLAALKAAAPTKVYLVRGNHESLYCSWVYGFRAEVLAKYGAAKDGMAVFSACRSLFSHLPLAVVVAGSTLVLHGGLPRAPPRRATRRSSGADPSAVTLASLADMAAASKGGDDPDPAKQDQRLAADVLWSDPGSQPGIELGARPGDVGIRFGPDVCEAFLRDNGLRLILRGHEGPDARTLRPEMPDMLAGYGLDHDTPCGKLYTVFSAPQYPQFGQPQYSNLGAVAVLSGPAYDQPRFEQYDAAPRPQANPYVVATEAEEEGAVDTAGVAEAAAGEDPGETGGSGDPGFGCSLGLGGGLKFESSSQGASSGGGSGDSEEEEEDEEEEKEEEEKEGMKQAHSPREQQAAATGAFRSQPAGGPAALAGKQEEGAGTSSSHDHSSGARRAAEEGRLGVQGNGEVRLTVQAAAACEGRLAAQAAAACEGAAGSREAAAVGDGASREEPEAKRQRLEASTGTAT